MDDQIVHKTTQQDYDNFVADIEAKIEAAKSRFIELDKKKAEWKAFREDYKSSIDSLIDLIGTDTFFQDADGTVYKTADCLGRFVYFDLYEVKRTRREGEDKGSLSMKEAREAGFEVEGK